MAEADKQTKLDQTLSRFGELGESIPVNIRERGLPQDLTLDSRQIKRIQSGVERIKKAQGEPQARLALVAALLDQGAYARDTDAIENPPDISSLYNQPYLSFLSQAESAAYFENPLFPKDVFDLYNEDSARAVEQLKALATEVTKGWRTRTAEDLSRGYARFTGNAVLPPEEATALIVKKVYFHPKTVTESAALQKLMESQDGLTLNQCRALAGRLNKRFNYDLVKGIFEGTDCFDSIVLQYGEGAVPPLLDAQYLKESREAVASRIQSGLEKYPLLKTAQAGTDDIIALYNAIGDDKAFSALVVKQRQIGANRKLLGNDTRFDTDELTEVVKSLSAEEHNELATILKANKQLADKNQHPFPDDYRTIVIHEYLAKQTPPKIKTAPQQANIVRTSVLSGSTLHPNICHLTGKQRETLYNALLSPDDLQALLDKKLNARMGILLASYPQIANPKAFCAAIAEQMSPEQFTEMQKRHDELKYEAPFRDLSARIAVTHYLIEQGLISSELAARLKTNILGELTPEKIYRGYSDLHGLRPDQIAGYYDALRDPETLKDHEKEIADYKQTLEYQARVRVIPPATVVKGVKQITAICAFLQKSPNHPEFDDFQTDVLSDILPGGITLNPDEAVEIMRKVAKQDWNSSQHPFGRFGEELALAVELIERDPHFHMEVEPHLKRVIDNLHHQDTSVFARYEIPATGEEESPTLDYGTIVEDMEKMRRGPLVVNEEGRAEVVLKNEDAVDRLNEKLKSRLSEEENYANAFGDLVYDKTEIIPGTTKTVYDENLEPHTHETPETSETRRYVTPEKLALTSKEAKDIEEIEEIDTTYGKQGFLDLYDAALDKIRDGFIEDPLILVTEERLEAATQRIIDWANQAERTPDELAARLYEALAEETRRTGKLWHPELPESAMTAHSGKITFPAKQLLQEHSVAIEDDKYHTRSRVGAAAEIGSDPGVTNTSAPEDVQEKQKKKSGIYDSSPASSRSKSYGSGGGSGYGGGGAKKKKGSGFGDALVGLGAVGTAAFILEDGAEKPKEGNWFRRNLGTFANLLFGLGLVAGADHLLRGNRSFASRVSTSITGPRQR